MGAHHNVRTFPGRVGQAPALTFKGIHDSGAVATAIYIYTSNKEIGHYERLSSRPQTWRD